MPIPSAFHERTKALCHTYKWKEWAGYYAVCQYDMSADREYNAVRQGAGLIDVTPLFKYEVRGPEAADFLARLMSRNVKRLRAGRMTYLCWCDDDGNVLDDGTCARLTTEHYRLTSATPMYYWFARHARAYDVTVEDVTGSLAALALQGPTSRDILKQCCDADMDKLRFFGITEASFGDFSGWISRTGYTGDLGYELWVENRHAVALWDVVMHEGKDRGVLPFGLDTLDITRIEAGFVLNGVDYESANEVLIETHKSTPFELGLGWTVKFKNRAPFIGERALIAEKARGSEWSFVGLELDWLAVERLYDVHGLPPQVPTAAWRTAVPVYRHGAQVGRATSGTWSPILKKCLALATVKSHAAKIGEALDIEITVEWERQTVPARIVKTPFFDPPRKRA